MYEVKGRKIANHLLCPPYIQFCWNNLGPLVILTLSENKSVMLTFAFLRILAFKTVLHGLCSNLVKCTRIEDFFLG